MLLRRSMYNNLERRSNIWGLGYELRPLVVAEAPDVAAAFEVVVHRAQVLRRIAVRHEAAPRSDQDRQTLDADGAQILAGAARRALQQHFFAVEVTELK